MVYSHQHNTNPASVKTHSLSKDIRQQTIKEKCYLCDVMNHNTMVINTQVHLSPVTVACHFFKSVPYNFTSIQLILSGGRAPPISTFLV
jgi:hypothetical protein